MPKVLISDNLSKLAVDVFTNNNIEVNVKTDLNSEELGHASKVEEKKIGDSDMIFITGCESAKSADVSSKSANNH